VAQPKKVLVVSYSQSGQLTAIVHSVLGPLTEDPGVRITHLRLEPEPAFPFPWTTQLFCDAFPEAFLGIPCDLKPLAAEPGEAFDLIVLAFQVWYLAPATPIWAFLHSPAAAALIKDRPVVTLIGCRNMWLRAQEIVKARIAELGGRLAGNIVLGDRAGNLVGVVTIARWMLTGKKTRWLGIFPPPGVADEDIRAARRFGVVLRKALQQAVFALDQDFLNAIGAVRVVPAFIVFEKRVCKIFGLWSRFIRARGGPGAPGRQRRVRAFFYYLLAAIALLAPLANAAAFVTLRLSRRRVQDSAAYFAGIQRRTPHPFA
jgi:hypothetical protein